ncbi:ComEA family DNA-binding protein [Schaalia odontolytica]|uniref:Competence protein ComEA n=2 Tax=Schaalia odontolytica TaxID=1660 RepID=A0A0V8RSM3_9ACTO|nr:competence protein ComEA [Schaalia odontolytica]QCT36446.1 ComEA family DNA-binding protein [Schaalia odontolytica]
MAALTKAVYDSALSEDDEPAEPSAARLLPGATTVAALIVVVVLIAAMGVWRHAAAREHSQALAQSSSEREESEAAPVATGPSPSASASASAGDRTDAVVVYVSGAVASPGVLTLPASSRVIDAITSAGGATPEADLESINLARLLVDGEQIRVGIVGESPPAASEAGTPAGACIRLATATEAELQTLPGIGPALAQRIISYRATHPRLSAVEELDDVPGIGPSLIEKIRPGVC